jgi:hypothetical protein
VYLKPKSEMTIFAAGMAGMNAGTNWSRRSG